MSEFRQGDVVRYKPDPQDRDVWWCREGMAIVTQVEPHVVILDTYWRSDGSDGKRLTQTEAMTAEVMFNVNDYDVIRDKWRWAEYRADDRAFVQSQHNLQHVYYVRRGAEPDGDQKIRNAYDKFMEAVDKATSAARDAEWTKRQLEELVTAALIETDETLAVGDRGAA